MPLSRCSSESWRPVPQRTGTLRMKARSHFSCGQMATSDRLIRRRPQRCHITQNRKTSTGPDPASRTSPVRRHSRVSCHAGCRVRSSVRNSSSGPLRAESLATASTTPNQPSFAGSILVDPATPPPRGGPGWLALEPTGVRQHKRPLPDKTTLIWPLVQRHTGNPMRLPVPLCESVLARREAELRG